MDPDQVRGDKGAGVSVFCTDPTTQLVMPNLIRHPPFSSTARARLKKGGSVARERLPAAYIMASGFRGTIYTGVTSDLTGRVHQHRSGTFKGFTDRYGCKRLVWFEVGGDMDGAIAREKQLKNWRREWKLALIEKDNPAWRDLAEDWGFEPLLKTPGAAR